MEEFCWMGQKDVAGELALDVGSLVGWVRGNGMDLPGFVDC